MALGRMAKDARREMAEMRKDYSLAQRAINVAKCAQEIECMPRMNLISEDLSVEKGATPLRRVDSTVKPWKGTVPSCAK